MDLKVELTGARCATCDITSISADIKRVNLFVMMHAAHHVLLVGVVQSPPEMEGVTVDVEAAFKEVQQ